MTVFTTPRAHDPDRTALRKCGFQLVGAGSEPGVIRFALSREAYETGRAGISV
jgi:hypothetical protein